ncbi:DUF5995 family protein [Candidatus Oscillochloris fontis]|uniref:DUF5995 family protein n=1 Tax=Candidatus Oscillochloris fontis TaxID=2496868 RepID=UPI001EE78BD8|nr:DUF5995 family protein [Candidatus Oscillochloris fontis]
MSDEALSARMAAQIATWQATGDRRSIFLSCYAMMTSNMFAGVTTGRFADRVWVDQLIHNFADYYFVALDAYEAQHPHLPEVWRLAYDMARQPETPVVQSLLLGVNAHINHDLVLVLADMLEPEWADLAQSKREERHRDYCEVNAVIAETTDRVQDEVVEPYARLMNLIDVVCGPLDEWCTAKLLRNWRADVWEQAIRIVENPDQTERQTLRQQADARALRRIELLRDSGDVGARVFGYPLRWLGRLRML